MAVFFLSDIHLSEKTPAVTREFIRCLHALAAAAPEGVFILGDLFDLWITDRAVGDFEIKIAKEIKRLSTICPVFFQRGNRDFLLAKDYCHQAGMTLLPDAYAFDYGGKHLLLMHGDSLCTDDLGYQRLRRILRSVWFFRLAYAAPSGLSRWVGAYLRRQSKRRKAAKNPALMDVHPAAVAAAMQVFSADRLIHGHTHRPARHSLGAGRARFVLGDWHPEGKILVLTRRGMFILAALPPHPTFPPTERKFQ